MAAKASKSSKSTPKKKSDSQPSYEVVVKEVESIVRSLESGELDLTESLEQYEKGIARLKECHEILESAEQKISLLSGFDSEGNPITEPMPETEFRTGANSAESDAGGAANRSGKQVGGRKRTLRSQAADETGDSVDGGGDLF